MNEPRHRIPLDDADTRSGSHTLAGTPVCGEPAKPVCNRRDISGRRQKARPAGVDDVCDSPHVRRHDGNPCGKSLDHADGRTLVRRR